MQTSKWGTVNPRRMAVADYVEAAENAAFTTQLNLLKAIQEAGDTKPELLLTIKEARQAAVNLHVGLQQLSRQVGR